MIILQNLIKYQNYNVIQLVLCENEKLLINNNINRQFYIYKNKIVKNIYI